MLEWCVPAVRSRMYRVLPLRRVGMAWDGAPAFGCQELLTFLVAAWLFWDPKGYARVHGMRNAETEYYRTCSLLFCCVRNRDDSALHFISRSLCACPSVVGTVALPPAHAYFVRRSATASFMECVQDDPPSATDIAAGLALVRLKQTRLGQQLAREHGCAADLAVSKHFKHPSYGRTPEEVFRLREARHFMEHAHAICALAGAGAAACAVPCVLTPASVPWLPDGWMLYVRANPMSGLCKLCCQFGCACAPHPTWGVTESSTCMQGNHTALNKHMSDFAVREARSSQERLDALGCEVGSWTLHLAVGVAVHRVTVLCVRCALVQVVYSCFWEGVVQSPFAVTIDRFKRAIVVSIRGTLSLADALQDADAAPEVLSAVFTNDMLTTELKNPAFMAHVGMLKGAKLIAEKLDATGVLREQFGTLAVAPLRCVARGG